MVGNILSIILKKLVSEKILTIILVKLGDYLVTKSSNKLDDAVWGEVKNVLQK